MAAEMTSAQVRSKLVDALKLDLVGPEKSLGDLAEVLPQSPSRWYLTGFLAPLDAPAERRSDADADDDLDSAGESGLDDDVVPETTAASKQKFLPSSIGLSVLLPKEATRLTVRVRWADYRKSEPPNPEQWSRKQFEEILTLELPDTLAAPKEKKIPGTGVKEHGLFVALMILPVGGFQSEAGLPKGSRTVSVFLVNRRAPKGDELRDEAFAFQTELHLSADKPLLPRPNTRGLMSDDWDENVADIQYQDIGEYAVGHNIAAAGTSTKPTPAGYPKPRWNGLPHPTSMMWSLVSTS